MVICAGIDLAAREHRPTGVAVVYASSPFNIEVIYSGILYKDPEIIDVLERHRVEVVAIDSPLALPGNGRGYRDVDIEMVKRGFHVLPPAWSYMKELTCRAIALTQQLLSKGFRIIETHPKSALKSSGCSSFSDLLTRVGAKARIRSRHEQDAIVAALVCVFHSYGLGLVVKAGDGEIVLLPRLC